jgi:hypothetical protein
LTSSSSPLEYEFRIFARSRDLDGYAGTDDRDDCDKAPSLTGLLPSSSLVTSFITLFDEELRELAGIGITGRLFTGSLSKESRGTLGDFFAVSSSD